MRTCSGSSMRSRATWSIRSRSPRKSTGVRWALSSTPTISTPPSTANCARSRASSLFSPLPDGSSRLKSRVCRSVRIPWSSASRSWSSLVGSHSITWSSSCDVGCLAGKGAVDRLGRVDDGGARLASRTGDRGDALERAEHPLSRRLGRHGFFLQVLQEPLHSIDLLGRELAVQLPDGGPKGADERVQAHALLGDGDIALPATVAVSADDVTGRALYADGVVGHGAAPCVDGGRDDVGDLLGGEGQLGGGHLAGVGCFSLELQDEVQKSVSDSFQHSHDPDPGQHAPGI